jgi:hypothetical protein
MASQVRLSRARAHPQHACARAPRAAAHERIETSDPSAGPSRPPPVSCCSLAHNRNQNRRRPAFLPPPTTTDNKQQNPFTLGDGDGYDLNTTYVPPATAADGSSIALDVDADAVVPAIGGGAAVGGATAAAAAAAAAAAPAPAPALTFAPSTASAAPVGGTIRPPAPGAAAGGGGGGSNGFPSSSRPPAAPPSASDDDDPSKAPFWSPRRYRPYFDVDTSQVLNRVAHSFLGPFRPSFMAATADSPDLYGPFWVATTLVLVTAVAGNYADYLSFSRWASSSSSSPGGGGGGSAKDAAGAGAPATPPSPAPGGGGGAANGTSAAPPQPPPEIPDPTGRAAQGGPSVADLQWYNDYAKVSYSALLFYGYVFALGFGLWFALRWLRSEMRLASVWCVYGYAMTAFVPAAFLCIAPAGWARSLVVALATASSGLFLVANLKAAIFEAAPARATALLGLVVAAHAGVGLALRMYFFSFSSKADLVAGGGGKAG